MFYFNTNKPQSFYLCRIPVALESRRLSRGGGGGGAPHLPPPHKTPPPPPPHLLHPPLRSAPRIFMASLLSRKNMLYKEKLDSWSLSWLTLIYKRYLLLTISPIYHSLISDGVGRGSGWRGGSLLLENLPNFWIVWDAYQPRTTPVYG